MLVALLLMEPGAYAAEPIDADGPDFVESSEVVGRGRFQYEADMMWVRDNLASVQSTPVLLKYGVTATTELRIDSEGYISDHLQTGVGDTAFGLKWHTQDRDEEKAAVSWILHFDTASGSREFSRPGVRPSLRSVMTWELPQNFALGVMPGIKYDTDSAGRRFASGILGVVLNRRVTEAFRAFIEMSAPQLASAQDGGSVAYWDVGAAYLLTRDSQLGGRAGVAANQSTPGRYFLMELAQRF